MWSSSLLADFGISANLRHVELASETLEKTLVRHEKQSSVEEKHVRSRASFVTLQHKSSHK